MVVVLTGPSSGPGGCLVSCGGSGSASGPNMPGKPSRGCRSTKRATTRRSCSATSLRRSTRSSRSMGGCSTRSPPRCRRRRVRKPRDLRGPVATPSYTRIAGGGLKYNRFHVTALCSPTRAALLTGRNSHTVGVGSVGEFAGGFPGQSAKSPVGSPVTARPFISAGARAGQRCSGCLGTDAGDRRVLRPDNGCPDSAWPLFVVPRGRVRAGGAGQPDGRWAVASRWGPIPISSGTRSRAAAVSMTTRRS